MSASARDMKVVTAGGCRLDGFENVNLESVPNSRAHPTRCSGHVAKTVGKYETFNASPECSQHELTRTAAAIFPFLSAAPDPRNVSSWPCESLRLSARFRLVLGRSHCLIAGVHHDAACSLGDGHATVGGGAVHRRRAARIAPRRRTG